jgi:hypothetical protein
MPTTKLILFLLFTSAAQAQNIQDFLIPTGSNVSHFLRRIDADKQGRKVTIWFDKQGDAFNIIQHDSLTYVKISAWARNDEIKFLEMVSFQHVPGSFPKGKRQDVNAQAQTYLKLPSATGAATWTINNNDGSEIKCSAVLVDMVVKGERKKTLKVRKDFYLNGKPIIQASVLEYYVQRIGLWKVDDTSGKIKQELVKQEYDKNLESQD